MTSGVARALVRYGYFPFMFFGLNGAAYYVVTNGHSPLWIGAGIAALLLTAIGTAQAAKHEAGASEKCYGVVKAGKNDCATATSSCAGTVKKDGQKDAWINVPKGTCEKIVGASLKVAK